MLLHLPVRRLLVLRRSKHPGLLDLLRNPLQLLLDLSDAFLLRWCDMHSATLAQPCCLMPHACDTCRWSITGTTVGMGAGNPGEITPALAVVGGQVVLDSISTLSALYVAHLLGSAHQANAMVVTRASSCTRSAASLVRQRSWSPGLRRAPWLLLSASAALRSHVVMQKYHGSTNAWCVVHVCRAVSASFTLIADAALKSAGVSTRWLSVRCCW
jgi:hypothetical protein